jgi:molybdenum cofactor guanylyltransferase
MGQDKALLPIEGKPLLVLLAEKLRPMVVAFQVVGPVERYEGFGYPVLPDLRSECGPMAGIEAALSASKTDWNLIVACDMPKLEASWLEFLLETAVNSDGVDCVASGTSIAEPNPLVAVWHQRALPLVKQRLDEGNFRVRGLLESIENKILIPNDPEILANWNRPEDVAIAQGEGKVNRGG